MAISSALGGQAALARHQAREILAEGRFHSAPIPRPLHGVLEAIGKALESPLHVINELISRLGASTPGGSAVVWGALAALVLLASGLFAFRGARSSLKDTMIAGSDPDRAAEMSAADLEQAAEIAEREGRPAEAVRLRFQAGLIRLSERELLDFVPSMPNAEVSRALRSERFDELARSFDEIVYGGRRAVKEDVQAARRGWSQVLQSGLSG